VLTRTARDNQPLRQELTAIGLEVLEAPCLEVAYVLPYQGELDALPNFADVDAILFSSKNGVRGFFNWLEHQPERR